MGRKEDSRVTRRVISRMTKTQQDIFNFPKSPKNVLWYLAHRFLLRGMRITKLEVWDGLLKRYVNDPKNGVRQTPEAKTSTRGNLTAQVFSEEEEMSVSTFFNTAVIAGAEEIEVIVVWKMPEERRIMGKVRYPLTPDVLLSIREEDEATRLITEVTQFLQDDNQSTDEHLQKLLDKLKGFKAKKSSAGESNE